MREFVMEAILCRGLTVTDMSSDGGMTGGRMLLLIGLGADEAVVVGVQVPGSGFGLTKLKALCFMVSSTSLLAASISLSKSVIDPLSLEDCFSFGSERSWTDPLSPIC